jgi:hypothetical protein
MPESLPVCGGIYIHHAGNAGKVFLSLHEVRPFAFPYAGKYLTPQTGRLFRHG